MKKNKMKEQVLHERNTKFDKAADNLLSAILTILLALTVTFTTINYIYVVYNQNKTGRECPRWYISLIMLIIDIETKWILFNYLKMYVL